MIVGFGLLAGMAIFIGAIVWAWCTRNKKGRRWE